MDATKAAKMAAALQTIQQRWGSQTLQMGRQMLNLAENRVGIATGFPTLDAQLPSGIPHGQTTELLGSPTSGIMTLAYHLIASAQTQVASAHNQEGTRDGILIDLEETFDADYAAHCGVQLSHLFLVRPDSPLEALDIAYDLLMSGQVEVLVLDLGAMTPSAPLLRRFTHVLAKSGSIVLILRWLEQEESAEAVISHAALRLQLERQSWLKQGRDIVGCRSTVRILKGPHRHDQVDLNFFFERHHPQGSR